MMWVRPSNATPKSYLWRCSVCGETAYSIPGDKPPGRFCPHCGEFGEYGVYQAVVPNRPLSTDETRFVVRPAELKGGEVVNVHHCVKCGFMLNIGTAEPSEFGMRFCSGCGRIIRDEKEKE